MSQIDKEKKKMLNKDEIINSNDSDLKKRIFLVYYQEFPLVDKQLYQYMEDKIEPELFIIKWYLCIFSREIELPQLVELWDLILYVQYLDDKNKKNQVEKDEDLRKLLFESNSIDNKIKLYNELIMENSKKGEDISYLMEMIMKLKTQKSSYQKKISEINTKKISLNYNVATSNSMNYSKTINPNISNVSKNNYSLKSQNINTTKKVINTEKNKLTKINKTMNNSKNNSKVRIKLISKKVATKEDIRKNEIR